LAAFASPGASLKPSWFVQDLVNRLARMQKHWSKWARRRGISCYRVYDRDIPEYPFIADIYEDHLILTDIASPAISARSDFDAFKSEVARQFLSTFAIPPQNLHMKMRRRQSEGAQYEKEKDGDGLLVHEAGLKFKVYPDNWLDSGLFLDHRNLRAEVRTLALEKKVLNLFCYTGSFSVYAAAGGATLVHSVDLSQTYLEICRENFLLNQLSTKHELIRVDAREFLTAAQPDFYDIIICDAPVFSKSKRQARDFDVLRDHPQLIRDALRTLTASGVLYFSTNFRKFRARFPEAGDNATVKNISARTIPEDFRNKWIHTCYEIRKT